MKFHNQLTGFSNFHLVFSACVRPHGVVAGMSASLAKALQGCIFSSSVSACLHTAVSWEHQRLRQRRYRTAALNGEIANNYHNKTWKRQN